MDPIPRAGKFAMRLTFDVLLFLSIDIFIINVPYHGVVVLFLRNNVITNIFLILFI
jgi:hypothetical protein